MGWGFGPIFNMNESAYNWRNDRGMECKTIYKKHFAVFPKTFPNGDKVWWKNYYKEYKCYTSSSWNFDAVKYSHTDFIECITEEEYIVRKLSENL